MKKRLFSCGNLFVTRGLQFTLAENNLTQLHLIEYLNRHVKGDFGILQESDKQLNREAVKDGERILSKYELSGFQFYVITEADRSMTTFLLPEEY